MVRLVFRPYTQVGRAICTSAPLRASTRVSSGFALLRHSSPSFGSQRNCSGSDLRSTTLCRLNLLMFQKNLLSLRLQVSPPFDSQPRSTPWSVFQDGSYRVITSPSSPIKRDPSAPGGPISPTKSSRRVTARANAPKRAEHARSHQFNAIRFPHDGFRFFSPSFQSAFHLSLTVLVRYRSPASI